MAHEENNIELNLDLLALDLTNDPNPVRYNGKPPEPEGVLVASIGSLTGILAQSVITQTPNEKVYYYVNDHLGTPVKVIDENGEVVWSADYKPFGGVDITADEVENNFRFPGQYYEEETGLHYNYHRYYDPKIGRYLRADPINSYDNLILYNKTGALHDHMSVHPFAYSLNNPIRFTDVLGLVASGSEECNNCEKDLDDCVTRALEMEVLCSIAVGTGTGICYVGCTAACLALSGPAIPACITSCGVTCTQLGEAGMLSCLSIPTAELAQCAYEYDKCKL